MPRAEILFVFRVGRRTLCKHPGHSDVGVQVGRTLRNADPRCCGGGALDLVSEAQGQGWGLHPPYLCDHGQ